MLNLKQESSRNGPSYTSEPSGSLKRARGIIDISEITLKDVPVAVEEKLGKVKGVFSAKVNTFSQKLTVEFDPSAISLQRIRREISREK